MSKKTKLNPNPVRPLTSREIVRVVNSVLGGFVGWCGVDVVMEVMDHLAENRKMYRKLFETLPMHEMQTCPKDGNDELVLVERDADDES